MEVKSIHTFGIANLNICFCAALDVLANLKQLLVIHDLLILGLYVGRRGGEADDTSKHPEWFFVGFQNVILEELCI